MTASRPILYHMPQTRSGATLWMNEELGAPCEVRLIDLKSGAHRKPDYLKLNPMGKVPTLVHGDVVVTETAAICAYLADAFTSAGLAPSTDDPARGIYYRWMFFSPSCIEPMMMDKLGGVTRENSAAVGHGDAERVARAIEAALANGPWLLGEKFSAADVVFGSTLRFATMFGALAKEGAIADYVDRASARPAAKRAEALNAEYMKTVKF